MPGHMIASEALELVHFLLAVTEADGNRDSVELRLIEKVATALGLTEAQQQSLVETRTDWSVSTLVGLNINTATVRLAISLALRVAHADGDYSGQESALIREAALALGVTQELLRELELEAEVEAARRKITSVQS